MNNVFTAKLLQSLRNKKGEKGFTLIELLVVVIIIGVLAAVALPNLLGQVGKARESEAKNIIGALNRAQQARFVERGSFAGNTTATPTAPTVAAGTPGTLPGTNYLGLLEVPTGAAKYYAFGVPVEAIQLATGNYDRDGDGTAENNNLNDGTRDYVGAIQYDPDTRDFQTVVCRATAGPDYLLDTTPEGFVATEGVVASDGDPATITALNCAGATEEVR